jgi:hypothetical protein
MTNKLSIGIVVVSLLIGSLVAAPRRLRMKPLPFEFGAKASYTLQKGADPFALGGEILFEAVENFFLLRTDFIGLEFFSGHNTLSFNTGTGFDGLLTLPLSKTFVPYGWAGIGFTVAEHATTYNLRLGLGANLLLAPGIKLFGEGGGIVAGDGGTTTALRLTAGIRFGR